MITTTTKDILTSIDDYSVILVQGNTHGWMGSGFSARVAKKWPKAFNEYHNYCTWFIDGHEKEILGTFAKTDITDKLIVCYCIAADTGKTFSTTNLDAWNQICKTIERLTVRIKRLTHVNWTIHAPENIGAIGQVHKEDIQEIFEYYFKDSPVQLVFHTH